MSNEALEVTTTTSTQLILRLARVVHVDKATLLVSLTGSDELHEVRSRLQTIAADPDVLRTGDEVVVADTGVELILWGRTGPLHSVTESRTPETLLLEAKQGLTLRVGDGSITIRADGKILIKGKDLVSHAKNVNRIKGGAVAIN